MLDSRSPYGRSPGHLIPSPLPEDSTGCWLMRRDLRQTLAPLTNPSAIRLLTLSPELAPQVHALLVLGYQQGGGSVPDYEHWHTAFATDPEFDPSLCFIAADERGLVGVAQCWTSAFIKDLVVDPRARRQGLARALLNHAFEAFRVRGEAWVDLKVMENNHDARRLYETSGMCYVQRYTVD